MPFAQSRFGTVELACMKAFEFHMKETVQNGNMAIMRNNAGFFPAEIRYGKDFLQLMKKSIPNIDIQGVWFKSCEEYFLKKYGNQKTICTYMFNNEPWRVPNAPWSAALKGKKVLVIHPFSKTIERQYEKNRDKLFQNTDILPEFDLKVMKAVQTIAGNVDTRFKDWFEALEYMYQEALTYDFDIAILGCGAYGYPLAAKLKKAKKQVCHLGGATQGLFGIRCRRFDEDPEYIGLRKFYNDFWIYPNKEDMPENYKQVENGCYWK